MPLQMKVSETTQLDSFWSVLFPKKAAAAVLKAATKMKRRGVWERAMTDFSQKLPSPTLTKCWPWAMRCEACHAFYTDQIQNYRFANHSHLCMHQYCYFMYGDISEHRKVVILNWILLDLPIRLCWLLWDTWHWHNMKSSVKMQKVAKLIVKKTTLTFWHVIDTIYIQGDSFHWYLH